jgi:hypothetical protein
MHRFCLLLVIAFLITTPAFGFRQTQNAPALKSFMPLRIQNGGFGSLTVRVVGPVVKTLKLGPSENQVVLVPPGEYYCLYRFKGEPPDPFIYKKTGQFQVPTPTSDKPNDQITVFAAEEDHPAVTLKTEVREVKPSTAAEFNNIGATPTMLANAQALATPGSADSLRLNSLDLVILVEELFYGETPAQKRIQKNRVLNHLNQYVRGVLMPKLTRQGFKVKNLGLREEAFEGDYPTEPTLVIEYSETGGQAYTMYAGYGEPSAYGVEISCSLTIYHPTVLPGLGIWDASLNAANDEEIKINFFADKEVALHNQALKYLRQQLNDLTLDLGEWAPRGAAAAAGSARADATGPSGATSTTGTRTSRKRSRRP